jgi:hypothetical protein
VKLEAIPGVGDVTARSLINVGIYSPRDILDWDLETLASSTPLGLKKAGTLKAMTEEYLANLPEETDEAGEPEVAGSGGSDSENAGTPVVEAGEKAEPEEPSEGGESPSETDTEEAEKIDQEGEKEPAG